MTALPFEQARSCVLSRVAEALAAPGREEVALEQAAGRVLAEPVLADRDMPPVARSMRDGLAVHAQDLPGEVEITGEARAGQAFPGGLQRGQAIEIMTGAPVPPGADAVVMIEHVEVTGTSATSSRTLKPGENIEPRGAQAVRNDVLIEPGQRLGFPEIALLAAVGRSQIAVFRKPQVAILATGDELVEVAEQPLEHQLRNSNSYSLAAQVERAGGCPQILPPARDIYGPLRESIEHGLHYDLLLLSGGVSAGKYDLVETVLADLGAEFFFDRILVQPGQPLVFGRVRNHFFFGLPGNPASTMVTFEVLGRAAVELLGGQKEPLLPLTWARLTKDFRQKPGLTRFLPARLSADGSALEPLRWQGSGDIPALARANAFLVTEPERETWSAGEMIRVLIR